MSGITEQAINILINMVAPFYGSDRIVGTTFNIAANVMVETTLRRLVGWKKVPWFDKIAYHTLAQPFEAGIASAGNITQVQEGSYFEAATDGARGIPALLLARYILYTYYGGFFIPKFDMSELMVVAATKILARPVIHTAVKWLPKTLIDQVAVIDQIYASQMENSRFNMK